MVFGRERSLLCIAVCCCVRYLSSASHKAPPCCMGSVYLLFLGASSAKRPLIRSQVVVRWPGSTYTLVALGLSQQPTTKQQQSRERRRDYGRKCGCQGPTARRSQQAKTAAVRTTTLNATTSTTQRACWRREILPKQCQRTLAFAVSSRRSSPPRLLLLL